MRINVYLAQQLGISRRQADRLIQEQRVLINGRVAILGEEIEPTRDHVVVDGKPIKAQSTSNVTIALYKPRSFLSTRSDPRGRKTVMDLLPETLHHLKPAGRLDYDSEGLVLMSNDGRFIFESTHPKFEKEKQYRVAFRTPVGHELLNAFRQGVPLIEGIAKADRLKQTGPNELELVLHQGWNRQIRRMAQECGYEVARIIRTRIGDVSLGNLKPGEWRDIGC